MFFFRGIKRRLLFNKNKRKFIALGSIVLALILLIRGFMWIEENIRPTFLAIAEARAKIIAFDAINEAINERVAQNIMYQDLVLIEKDREGKIMMAQTNTMEVNRVQAETVRRVQNSLRKIEGEKIKIPLGQVLGSQILATYGPTIPVNLVPIGTVHVDVSHSFRQAGINQTRHKIYLEVFADVQVVIPFISTSREVKTAVPVADTIYMGDVPDTVINLPFPKKNDSESQVDSFSSTFSNDSSNSYNNMYENEWNESLEPGRYKWDDDFNNNLPYFNK